MGALLARDRLNGAVWVLDRRLPATNERVDGVTYVKCDLRSKDDIEATPWPDTTVTVIYAAGNLEATWNLSRIEEVFDDNLLSPIRLLTARGDTMEHFTLISSISVYGVPEQNPMTESHTLAPTTAYGASKAAGELAVESYSRHSGLPMAVLRSTQLFGVASASESLPHRVLRDLERDQRPQLTAVPGVYRDYLAGEDLADVVAAVASNKAVGIFNVGSGEPVELEALFEAGYTRFGLKWSGRQAPVDDTPFSQWLDITKAQDVLDFTPSRGVLEWMASAPLSSNEVLGLGRPGNAPAP